MYSSIRLCESGPVSQPARDLRDPGYPSARSLLLTVLGEFVHTRGGRTLRGSVQDKGVPSGRLAGVSGRRVP